MIIKPVFRLSSNKDALYLFRLIWTNGNPGDGVGYSAKLAFYFEKKILNFRKSSDGIKFSILGISIRYKRSYGGYFV